MPVSQLIIGIDLAPIKPISNVITLIDDITTEKCRTDLKRELKTWKADVFLNDGAPNVGSSWAHDAFTQAELVLSALKLATEFLVEGGTFVTKVFRSKDYNSLLWVFKQLFKTVEATKPASSRSVSAEIFVVCRGFLAPSSIDPRFLDPKHVFEELPGKASSSGQSINILQPEKKQRHRDGYEDGQMIIHKAVPVMDYILARDPVGLLSSTNQLTFTAGQAKELKADEEIQMFCEDLKVLGRKDFKALLKWRLAQRAILVPATEKAEEGGAEGAEGEKEEPKEVDPLKELDDLAGLGQRLAKREKRKDLEKKAKQRLRLQLQMEHGADIADDMHEEGLFNIRALKRKAKLVALEGAQSEAQQFSSEEEDDEVEEVDGGQYSEAHGSEEEPQDEILDSADEAALWDEEMEVHYKRFKAERLQKDALRFVKEKHAELDDAERADGLDDEPRPEQQDASDYESDAGSDDAGLNVDIATAAERKEQMGARAERFFSNPIFSVLDKAKAGKRSRAEKTKEVEAEDPLEELAASRRGKKKQRKPSKEDEAAADEKKTSGIVFVKADPMPADEDEDYDDAGLKAKLMTDPKTMSLATQLVADRRRRRDDLVDKSFNRYAFGDGNLLPSWFREDESRHNKPQEPISKEAADLIKERMKRLEAAPNKKVLEAKGRNKMRAMKRLEALKRKATVIADSEEIGGRQKSEQIEKIMRSAKKPTKKEKKLVVAKGKLRGVKGRPKGVKGHYKMVDNRAKKDTRAKIRVQKKRKAGRK